MGKLTLQAEIIRVAQVHGDGMESSMAYMSMEINPYLQRDGTTGTLHFQCECMTGEM